MGEIFVSVTSRYSFFSFKVYDLQKADSISLDGSDCGVLSMGEEEAACFSEIVRQGCASFQAEFTSEGDLALREDWVLWHTRSGRERREKKDRRCGLERRSRENRRSDDRSAENEEY